VSADQEKRFDGRVAIVTGAGAGMGREHAKLLAARGACLVVNDVSKESADETVTLIEDCGGTATASYDDISAETGAQALVAKTIDVYGRVDIVVNNAGIFRESPFAQMSYEHFDTTMKVNTYGAFSVTKAAWPHFIEQGYGRVLFVASSAGLLSLADASNYAASKGALVGLGRSLAAEGAEYGINVNIMLPVAATGMGAKPLSSAEAEETRQRVLQFIPAALISPVVAWLVHEDNTLQGEIIESGAGRAAVGFFGSGSGFWSDSLSIEDLFVNDEVVLSRDSYQELKTAGDGANWMFANSRWNTDAQG
jgi:NAD(P)-dependent dehydrogenase (short-subunit alcohol dehydrogenase family)